MKDFLIVFVIKILNLILKICKKKGGNLPGKLAYDWDRNIFKYFKIDCPVIAVTATNGKTMTNNAIRTVFETAGKKVVSNIEGNNMETGILSTLLKNCSLTGKVKADYLVFEVDENYIPVLFKDLKLDTLVILNFFRDQLDRNGEIDTLINKINTFLNDFKGNLVLNGNDPNVVRLGLSNPDNNNIFYFGVDKTEESTEVSTEACDGKFCPICNEKLEYDYYQYSQIGKFKCPNCNYGDLEMYKTIQNIDFNNKSFDVSDTHYEINSNSIYIMYNFAAVIACASLYNIESNYIQEALKSFKLDNGRLENTLINNVPTLVNLAKNPAGFNVSLRLLKDDDDKKDLFLVVNDNKSDGYDISWIWDVNFEDLNNYNIDRIILSGLRPYDLAIRIKTAGFDVDKIECYENLDEAVKSLYSTNVKKYVIANYTALQPTRKALGL